MPTVSGRQISTSSADCHCSSASISSPPNRSWRRDSTSACTISCRHDRGRSPRQRGDRSRPDRSGARRRQPHQRVHLSGSRRGAGGLRACDPAGTCRARSARANGRRVPAAAAVPVSGAAGVCGRGVPYQALDALPLAAEPFAAAVDLMFTAIAADFTRAALVELLRMSAFLVRCGERNEVVALDRYLFERKYLGAIERLRSLASESMTNPNPKRSDSALAAAVRRRDAAGRAAGGPVSAGADRSAPSVRRSSTKCSRRGMTNGTRVTCVPARPCCPRSRCFATRTPRTTPSRSARDGPVRVPSAGGSKGRLFRHDWDPPGSC